jgi:hypothetical protein
MKCPRPSLLLRLSPPNTWRASRGTAVRPLWRSLVATLRVLGVTSWVLSTLRLVASVVAVACLPVRGLLALRAALLRLAVSPLAPPSTAAHSSAFAPAAPGWRLRVCGQWAVLTRDAQPFNQPDMPRQAGSCRLSQTLGITVGRHAFGPPLPSLGFE